MISEPVPPHLVECVDSVRMGVFVYLGDDTFSFQEGREISLVTREKLTAMLRNFGGSREVD
jgi:hypothetical protein